VRSAALREFQRVTGVERATRRWLMFVVVPLWLGAGLLDWFQHRKTHIEHTSGARESAIHALMLSEAGLPALLGLFLEVNAGVLLTSLAGLIAHEATAFWDVAYAETRRRVTPNEQHIHSLLEVVPLMALSFLTVLHWEQAQTLVGFGPAMLDFRLRPKVHPLKPGYVWGLLLAILTVGAIPYAEEFWRCYRADPTLAPQPEPALPPTDTLRVPV
jgi:Sodium:solute symporter family